MTPALDIDNTSHSISVAPLYKSVDLIANLKVPSCCCSTAQDSLVKELVLLPSVNESDSSKTGVVPSGSTIGINVVPSLSTSMYRPFSSSLLRREPALSVEIDVRDVEIPMEPSPFKS